jgi:hypothetical protein
MSNSPVIRPAGRADIDIFARGDAVPSIRAVCMEVDGKVIALGGVAYAKGRWIGFCDLTPEARRYKMRIMRAARRFLDEARRDGIRFIYAGRDTDEPRSLAWLTSLGFVLDPRSQSLYRWSAK